MGTDNPTTSEVAALRLHLCRAGFIPLPLFGKEPPIYGKNNKRKGLTEWTALRNVTRQQIEMWSKTWPDAINTGILARDAPALDIDILIEPAARAVEELAREILFDPEEQDNIYVRFGLPPKRLIPLRTDEPFKKLYRLFRAPDGSEHKLEFLGDGQQYVVAGIHPKTGKPYAWYGGELTDIKRENLPYTQREKAEQFLDAATKLLVEEFGFTLISEDATTTNGGGEPHEQNEEPQASPARVAAALEVIPNDVDWDEWNRVGMATWRATGGAKAGFIAFDRWSRKSPKYNAARTKAKWAEYSKYPPKQIGAATIFYLADQNSPTWRNDFEDSIDDVDRSEQEQKQGGSQQGPQPGSKPDPQPDPKPQPPKGILRFHRHGEVDPLESRTWTVLELIPEVGCGLISGQWGTLKTFNAMELAHCCMTGRAYLGHQITRRGGVLFLAPEGASEVSVRIQGPIDHKGPVRLEHAPFYWCDECPPLTHPKSADVIIKTAKWIAKELQERFGLPLVLIIIDTIITAAGYKKEGADNDAAVTHAIMNTMAKVAREVGCFVFGIDHFGKDANVGTRGSSAKEAAADVILATLGDKSEGGKVSNCRLALRKRRSGPNGEEFPFHWRVVQVGTNKYGKLEETLVLSFGEDPNAPRKQFQDENWGKAKPVLHLRKVIMSLMAEHGQDIHPFPDGKPIRALKVELVEAEFLRSYPIGGKGGNSKEQILNTRQRAFRRGLEDATIRKSVLTTREIHGVEWVWLSQRNKDETGPSHAEDA